MPKYDFKKIRFSDIEKFDKKKKKTHTISIDL
jgi:hypothetical protein